MKQIGSEQIMTVKEVAEILGVTERTIRNYIEKLYPDLMQNGIETVINEGMFSAIKNSLVKNYSLKVENAFQVISDIDLDEMALKVIDHLRAKVESQKKQLEQAENRISLLIHNPKTYIATELAKELNMKSAAALNAKLFELSVQFKLNGTWTLYSKYSDLGYTSTKEEELENGTIIYNRHWTGEGREFVLNLFKRSI